MLTITTDPISGNDVGDPEKAPFVIEGRGSRVIKIHFESLENRAEYLVMRAADPTGDPVAVMRGGGNSGTIN